jgi:uncharacterized protein YecT (DUF1311 family)
MNRIPFVFALIASVHIYAASFDCSKARAPVEKAICTSPKLSADDDRLALAYRAALTNVPEAAALVREAQLKWLQSAGQNCRPDDAHYPFADCLAIEWENRVFFLNGIAVRMGGVSFFFREISIKMTDDNGTEETGNASDSKGADPDDAPRTFHATWPEALSNAPQWKAWNKALVDEARRFNASQDAKAEVPDHWVLFPDPTWHSDLDISIDLNSVSPTLVATTINRDYTYAHPAHQERAFNWLLKQDRELEPEDLFRPDSSWEAWIKSRTAQIVLGDAQPESNETPSDAIDIAATAARVAVEPRYWQIERKGLTLIFTEDELGYLTALTMPTVTLSWSDLRPYLNPNFEIPR